MIVHLRRLAVVIVLLSSMAANADVIYDQYSIPPPNVNVIVTSGSDVDIPQEIADDFILDLGGPAILTGLEWVGRYASGTPPATDNFTFRLYEDRDGIPVLEPFAELAPVSAVTRTLLGAQFADLFSFSASVAPTLISDATRYHVSVVADTTGDPANWTWYFGSGTTPFASRRTDVMWIEQTIPRSYSFRLSGDLATDCEPFPGGGDTGGCFPGPGPFPAPEPGTLALFAIGLFGMGLSRRRKKI